MDRAEGSQTYQYMHGIDHGRGSRVDAAKARESMQQRHANQGGPRTEVRRAVCELQWMDLTTYDVSASSREFICQICARKINHFVENGLEIRVRCGG